MKSNWRVTGTRLIILLVIFKIWSAYPVQDMVARYHGFINPKAYKFFHPLTEHFPNWVLVRLMDDGNFNLANNAATDLCARGANAKRYFDSVQKMTQHKIYDVRSRAYGVLDCLDKSRAIIFYLQEMERLPKDSPEYKECLRLLVYNSKDKKLLPYLLEYANRPDGWRNASCMYLEEYGDPEALPVLYEQRKKAEEEISHGDHRGLAKMELKRINQAVATLEAIKTGQAVSQSEQ